MPRPRTRPIHPYIAKLMQKYALRRFKRTGEPIDSYTLKDLSNDTKIPYETLRNWADNGGGHPQLEAVLRAAKSCNVPVEEFIRGLISRAS